jgi:two-component system response regulator GlrR
VCLIRGESGTGKEMLAQAIHQGGPRQKPFIAVNCGPSPRRCWSPSCSVTSRAPSPTRHRSAWACFRRQTAAPVARRDWRHAAVAAGRCLRVLQERVRLLGSSQSIPVDVRVISATHRDLMPPWLRDSSALTCFTA